MAAGQSLSCHGSESPGISESRYRDNIRVLASDAFEGRAPGTAGGAKTTAFIERKFREAGLQPGNGDRYLQPVHLVSITTAYAQITVCSRDVETVITHGEEILVLARRVQRNLAVTDSELVFIGYGVVAPESDWNDYQDIDVSGKTVLILSNDPGYLSGRDDQFMGKGVTYYARDSYKYEEAERRGAAAAFIIHDTEANSKDWLTHVEKHRKPRLVLNPVDEPPSSVLIEGYLSDEYASVLLHEAGLNYQKEKKKALSKGYKAQALGSRISASLSSEFVASTSYNVLGKIPGTTRPGEYVIILAHWDHLGRDGSRSGDQIFNGARDNAAGVASLIELGHAFITAENRNRTIVVMAVTAEEGGLLGSYYYVKNPIYPLSKTVGAINLDMMNLYGKTNDVLVHGVNNSPLMDRVIKEAIEQKQGRQVKPFGLPEAGIAYRNDGFSFNRSGIPTIGLASGVEHLRNGRNWMQAKIEDYFTHHYHQVSDEYEDRMDFSGAILDTAALFYIATSLANSEQFAHWYENREFKYLRDVQLSDPDAENGYAVPAPHPFSKSDDGLRD